MNGGYCNNLLGGNGDRMEKADNVTMHSLNGTDQLQNKMLWIKKKSKNDIIQLCPLDAFFIILSFLQVPGNRFLLCLTYLISRSFIKSKLL